MENHPSPKIPEDVRTLAEAVSTNSRLANRLWLFAAFVTMCVIGTKEVDGVVTLLTIEMSAPKMYTVAALLLALVNLSFCSAHSQAYYASNIYAEFLEEIKAEKVDISKNFKLKNVAYVLPLSTFSRMYPLNMAYPVVPGNQISLASAGSTPS